jgi:hypothetical protein
LRDQIEHHLPELFGIVGKMFRIEGHATVKISLLTEKPFDKRKIKQNRGELYSLFRAPIALAPRGFR